MSSLAGRNDRFTNALNGQGQGKGTHTMKTRTLTINRRRWLRLMTALMGVMLLALQITPALAASTALDNLSYRLGKEDTGYDVLMSSQSAGAGNQLALSAAGGGQTAVSGISGLSSERIDALEEAAETLRGSQQPSSPDVDEPADADYGDAPDSNIELTQTGEPTLVISDDFDNAGDSSLWTGAHEGGEAFINEEASLYVMLVQPGVLTPILAASDIEITDGAIVTDARFYGEGDGDLGLIGRAASDYSVYYYCMIDVYGGAGCYLHSNGEWTNLFYSAPGEVTRYQMDRLILDISNDTLTFSVNDEIVGTINDAGLTGGSWGLATSCYEGSCSGNFDFIDVYSHGSTGNEAQMTTVLATDFSDAPAEAFFIAEGDWGFADINDGWYTVSLAPGLYFPNMINGTDGLSNAVITADMAYNGSGIFGLTARHSFNADGAASYYACYVTTSAFANCMIVVDDEWYYIEGSEGVEVTLQEINRLSLGLLGDQLVFAVNGQVVTDVSDGVLQSGAVGFFHEADGDSNDYFSTFVDAVTVETLGGSSSDAVIGSDLNDDNDLGLYIGSGDWGFADFVYEGVYTVEMGPGLYFANAIVDTAFIESGVMTTVVDFGGAGSTGLIARHQSSDSGDSFYVCWLDNDAYAGCNVVVNDEWYSLGYTDQPLQLDGSTEMSLAIYGSEITFIVNGAVVIETIDETLTAGNWGFFNDAYSNGEGAWADYDLVIIEELAVN